MNITYEFILVSPAVLHVWFILHGWFIRWEVSVVPIPTGQPHYLSFLKPLMASDSSDGFSHLWPGVFLIPLQICKTQKYNREGGRKEQTNQHALGSAPSARRREVYVTLFVHSVFLCAIVSVYLSENSHKATSNADLTSRIGHPGICGSTGPSSRLSDFC